MSKISELSDGGALQSTDYLIAVRSGGNVKVQLSELPSGIGAGGNIVFGDNEKAIFGAGSDLQIYHDGSNSYVQDLGTGKLTLKSNGTATLIQDSAGGAQAEFHAINKTVTLYYDNAAKLATTATGIDVTGNVTADGLTSAGDVNIQKTAAGASQGSFDLIFQGTNSSSQDKNQAQINSARWESNSNAGILQFYTANNLSTFVKRMDIDGGGDISFYEDTGTTPKFFWDASAEALGIGDSSPDGILDVEGSITIAGSQAGVIFNPSVTPANNNVGSIGLVSGTLNAPASVNASSKISGLRVAPTTSGSFNGAGEVAGVKVETFNGQSATLATGLYVDAPTGGDVNYAAILNGGNVGIGTTSPSYDLSIVDSDSSTILSLTASNTNIAAVYFGDADIGNVGRLIYDNSNDSLQTYVNGVERMRIDSSGNVGIGTSNPARLFHVEANTDGAIGGLIKNSSSGSSAFANLVVRNDANSNMEIGIQSSTRTTTYPANEGWIYVSDALNLGYNGATKLYAGGAERARLDASGNLLVGTTQTPATLITTSTTSHAGVGIADGYLSIARDLTGSAGSGGLAFFNRLATDGPIVDFRKDGTTVGSIRSKFGDLVIGNSGTVGIRFDEGAGLIPWDMTADSGEDAQHDIGASTARYKDLYLSGVAKVPTIHNQSGLYFGSSASMLPTNSSGALADNTVGLGDSARRFTDLYLSGGVYLGGTGAANLLDDYEEGTWTPTVSGLTNITGTAVISHARYTKVGRIVHCSIAITGLSVTAGSTDTSFTFTIPFTAFQGAIHGVSGTVNFNSITSNGAVNDSTGANNTTFAASLPAEVCGGSGAVAVIALGFTYEAS
jgi:hypothetical protein